MTDTWTCRPFLAIDTETTGIDPFEDRVVTAAVLHIDSQHGVRTHEWLINPGIDIPQQATDVHGITNDVAQSDGADPHEALTALRGALTDEPDLPWLVFNAPFDLTLLTFEFARHNVGALPHPAGVIDPLVLDRALSRRTGRRRLTDACAHYGIPLGEDAHGAGADALAAARLGWTLARRYPEARASLPELWRWQQERYATQADQIEARLIAEGRPTRLPREWPIQELTEDVA